MRAAVLAALLLAAAAIAPARAAVSLPDEPAERYIAIYALANGPESPATLEKYLDVKRKLKPTFEENVDGAMQWSLREVSTRPAFGPAVFGVMRLRSVLDDLLKQAGLTSDDYTRLTMLVYGKWWRAVRPSDPPEKRVLRVLQELQVGLERHLANNPPPEPEKKKSLEDRLASVTFQARYVALWANADRQAVLSKLDQGTRDWLREHRKDVEELDFGIFDTAAPPRQHPPKK